LGVGATVGLDFKATDGVAEGGVVRDAEEATDQGGGRSVVCVKLEFVSKLDG
jgi:hypothetical protein